MAKEKPDKKVRQKSQAKKDRQKNLDMEGSDTLEQGILGYRKNPGVASRLHNGAQVG